MLFGGQIVHTSLLSPLNNPDIFENRWIRQRTESCKFRLVEFAALVLRIVFEKDARNPILRGRRSANGYAFGFGVLQAAFDALADDVALKLAEYAHHFQHTLCHGVKLLRTIDDILKRGQ